MFEVLKYKNISIGIFGALVIASIVCVAVFGLTPGTDLVGGTRWQVRFTDESIDASHINEVLKSAGAESSASVNEEGVVTIRLGAIDEPLHAVYRTALSELGEMEELNFSSIGPTVGAELQRKAKSAILFVLIGISLYIAWAFRKVSVPVKSWKYGLVTLITLFHDVAVPTGFIAVLGYLQGIEVDTNFIVALLVVLGFSVHNTIVVFDRVRENLLHARGKADFAGTINMSVHETIVRSVNTSLTLILVLIALIVAGPASLFYFLLVILVGTVIGTFSSIFVASPLLYLLGRAAKE